jgi:hypothetical protein
LNKAPIKDLPLVRQAYSACDFKVLQKYRAEMRTRCIVENYDQLWKKQKQTKQLMVQQELLRRGFETNIAKRWRVDLRQTVGDCAELQGFIFLRRAGYICNSGDSGHEPKGASEKLALGIPVRKLPSAEGSYGGTAQSCDLGSRNRDADGSVASNAPACSDFGDGFLSESTNEDQSLWCTFIESNPQLIWCTFIESNPQLIWCTFIESNPQLIWCTFIESNPQLIEEEDHIPLFVEVLGRHGPIIQRQFKTQSESI